MMNMMSTTGMGGSAFTLLWGVHILAVIAFFIGLLFLVILATKTFTHAQLRTWGVWLVIGGTILCLLTIGARGSLWMGHGNGGFGKVRMMPMMGRDIDDVGAMRGMAEDGMGMSMMLRGKTGDEFDRAFIALMIPHHQDAINMAELALQNAAHQELKNLATDIISAQQREIDLMQEWESAWGYAE